MSDAKIVLDLHRLAEEADRRGIRIMREPISGEHFATSATDPTLLHRVTGFSCSCRGFLKWGRCTHFAALLASEGWLPEPDPVPTTPVPAPLAPQTVPAVVLIACPLCAGSGVDDRYGTHSVSADLLRCPVCEGTGTVEALDEDRSHLDAHLDECLDHDVEDLAA